MKEQRFTEKMKKTWYAMTIKRKIFAFIGAVVLTLILSIVLNVWVAKFSLIDFSGILSDNTKSSELVLALEGETKLFTEYIKSPSEEKWKLLDVAMKRTEKAVYTLPFEYSMIGEERYAQTWSIRNAYKVYIEKRNDIFAAQEEKDYIQRLYEVYEMQTYLQKYASNLMTKTIEDGNVTYRVTLPELISVPIAAFVIAIILFWCILVMAQLMHKTIIVPVMKLADNAKRIAANDFFTEDVKVENKDELGELVYAFNKMKFATGEYITALEEKRKTLDLLHEEELEKLAIEHELENMKFDLLKNQINPHFLFNTLNVIAGMANLEDAAVTEKMIRSLSDLFRYNLKTTEAEVPLTQELKVVEDYMYLQQMRFGKRVTYDIRCEVDKELTIVPVFTFQPIVENAIIHGVSKKEEGGHIRIRVWENEKELLITIGDTGVGMTKEELEKMRKELIENDANYHGIGLSNVYKRVKTMYPNGEVEVFSKAQAGTVVKLVLPKRGEVSCTVY